MPKDVKRHTRYQIIALSSHGLETQTIAEFSQCSIEMVYRWKGRLDVNDKARLGRPSLYNQEIQLKVIALYCQTTPLPGCGRWSLRWAEKHLPKNPEPVGKPISHSTIGRILNRHHLKPHLSKYFLQITDPDFFTKMKRIISLYFNQPKYLFSFDECPGIRVLQRPAPHPGTEETMKRPEEFEYIRNGTIDVFAFLRVKSGKVFAECKSNHTTGTLIEVFEAHLKTLPEKLHNGQSVFTCKL